MTKQLNVFVENRPGRLESVTLSLMDSRINIMAFALQDKGDYGLLKLIVDKPDDAYLALADKGFACALKDMLAISVPDKPGNLHKLTTALAEHNINVIDAYGFVLEPTKKGICCLEIEDLKATNASEVVEKAGFTVLTREELCSE
ncbi:MAG: ACT domain-containing protein [Anaerohalosphaera sp.]|nr:ACT domain-containing protein [Anaerohalosphaera sp.]